MASTYTPLKIELITTGEQSATWGTTTNVNITAIEEAITGSVNVPFTSGNDVTLTLTNTNGTQPARNLRLRLTGPTGGARNLIVPQIEKQYIVVNETSDSDPITIKNITGTGVVVPYGMSTIVFNDGLNVTNASVYSSSLVTPLLAATNASFVTPLPVTSGGTGANAATGTGDVVRATSPQLITPLLGTPTSGNLTNCTNLPLTTGITGTLQVGNGGTGVTTSTGTGSVVRAESPTLTTPILGTPQAGSVLTNCNGLPLSTGIVGVLGVTNGGTGVTTFTGTGSNVLSASPSLETPILGTPQSGNLTNCTNLPLTSGVTGLLPILNGGTGATTTTGSGANVLSSSPSLTSPILGTPQSGNLANCTNVVLPGGVTGTLSIAKGGTGATDQPGALANVVGFTPVQQGGGAGQGSTKVSIGWTGTVLTAVVGSSNLGSIIGVGGSGQFYLSPNRTTGTEYVNNTGRPIQVIVILNSSAAGSFGGTGLHNRSTTVQQLNYVVGAGYRTTLSWIVQEQANYQLDLFGNTTVVQWRELSGV